MKEEIKHIVESLLFVSDTPLSVQRIQKILNLEKADAVREALRELNEDYEARKGGFCLREVAGGYQLRTRGEYKEWIRLMIKTTPARLSKAALETLAIIAYKQPVIRSDVEHIRGVDSGGVLRQLLERKLIRVMGRKEIAGRPMIYGTTREFLELFGLKDLKDLPTLKEIKEFARERTDLFDMESGDAGPEGNGGITATAGAEDDDWLESNEHPEFISFSDGSILMQRKGEGAVSPEKAEKASTEKTESTENLEDAKETAFSEDAPMDLSFDLKPDADADDSAEGDVEIDAETANGISLEVSVALDALDASLDVDSGDVDSGDVDSGDVDSGDADVDDDTLEVDGEPDDEPPPESAEPVESLLSVETAREIEDEDEEIPPGISFELVPEGDTGKADEDEPEIDPETADAISSQVDVALDALDTSSTSSSGDISPGGTGTDSENGVRKLKLSQTDDGDEDKTGSE